MCKRLNLHIETNNILSNAQIDFRKVISAEDGIFEFLDDTHN